MGPHRIRQAEAAFALALVATAGIAPASLAADPSDRIAYSRQVGFGAEILTANSDGSDEVVIPLGDPAEDFAIPVWSPDHSRLLISNTLRFDGDELLPFRPAIVRPDGSDYDLLEIPDAPFDMYCGAWSGDGSRIYCGVGAEAPGIYSFRSSDGGDSRRLTASPFGERGSDVPLDVSPDGTRLLFMRERMGPGPDPQPFRPERFALFVINVDGTDERRIVPWGIVLGHELEGAHWSPDGRSIISSNTGGRLFTVSPNGGAIRFIDLDIDGFAFMPNWAPDGTRIVFGLFGPEQEDLYTADPDSANVERITDTPNFELGPDWR
jgi:Tol biopolymer transport system component